MFLKLAYRTYWFTSSIKHWASRKFTSAGLLALSGLAISAILGLDTNRTMAYQIFTLLLSILVVSIIFNRLFRARFSVSRTLSKFATAGEPFTYKIKIKNLDNSPHNGLELIEDFADPRPSFEEFIKAREPGESERNVLDRSFGYYRWRWLISLKETIRTKGKNLETIHASSESTSTYEMTPLRRGHIRLQGMSIMKADPFGLLRTIVSFDEEDSLLVLPKRYRTGPIKLPGSRKYNQGGVAYASSLGDSEECVSLRDYRPGDPLRNIHWKSWAKTGRPVVKEYQQEYFSRYGLILDTFTDIDGAEIFEEAVSVAASFAANIETNEAMLDLMFVGAEAYCFTAGRSLGHSDMMLEILASVRACYDKTFSALEYAVIERASLLSGCVIILLAWDDKRKNFIKRFKSMGIPVKVFVITSQEDDEKYNPGPMSDELENFHVLKAGNAEMVLSQI